MDYTRTRRLRPIEPRGCIEHPPYAELAPASSPLASTWALENSERSASIFFVLPLRSFLVELGAFGRRPALL